MPSEPRIAGVILAGGLSRRMGGGDKTLRRIGGRTILEHVIERAAPQVEALVLNANGDPERFAATGLPVAADALEGHPGPLAGVLTGLDWAIANVPTCSHLASFACDAPFLPRDLVTRLHRRMRAAGAELACARSAGRDHPVFALWPVALAEALRRAVLDEGIRKVDRWTARYALATEDFAAQPVDPFFNVNRPEDIAAAETQISALDAQNRV